MDRRNFLKTCAFTTGVVGLSLEEKTLLAQAGKAKESRPAPASMTLPTGQIGKLKISRLVCGGMCDFQVREDAIIANKTLTGLTRPRPWRA
jgi:hypothetical protein